MQKLYTVKETMEILRVSRMQIYRLRDSGKLEFYQAGRSVKISQAAIEKYLKAVVQKSTARGFEYLLLKQFQTGGDMTEPEKHEYDNQMFALY